MHFIGLDDRPEWRMKNRSSQDDSWISGLWNWMDSGVLH